MDIINTAKQFLTTFSEAIKETINNVNPECANALLPIYKYLNTCE